MNIVHDEKDLRFVALDTDGAVLEYALPAPGIVDFTHTFVPPELRGHGIAEALVRAGIDWARKNNFRIKASCGYVARILERENRSASSV